MELLHNVSLKPYNTFGIDVKAHCVLEYDTVEELAQYLQQQSPTYSLLHVGRGSNLLFLKDFDGTILHSRIRDIQVTDEDDEHVWVRCGSGVDWDTFVAYTIEQGWSGLENLSLIPGEVGASAVQNIGAYGAEAKDFIKTVECITVDGCERVRMDVSECAYAYRSSVFKTTLRGRYFVTHVTYRLNKQFLPRLDYGGIRRMLEEKQIDVSAVTPQVVRDVIISIRQSKLPDPIVQGNAGSFFMNPVVERPVFEAIRKRYPEMPFYKTSDDRVKIPAGWLIEQCGWKGRSMGNAAVHDRQALVLVNRGGANGNDIVALCDAVRTDVKARFGIDIHPEVNFIY